MFRGCLHSGSWSAFIAWRRALQLREGSPLQSYVLHAVCRSSTVSNWSAPSWPTASLFAKQLYSSPSLCGLEEFFPKTDNLIEEGEKTGMLLYSLVPRPPFSAALDVLHHQHAERKVWKLLHGLLVRLVCNYVHSHLIRILLLIFLQ